MDDTKAQQMIDRMRDRGPGEPRPQPDMQALILALWARNEQLEARVAALEPGSAKI